jgi:hypothetical protein
MEKHMSIALSQSYKDPLESFLRVLNELIESLKESHKNVFDNISTCHQIRKNRKHFEKLMEKVICDFNKLSDKDKSQFELGIYNILQKIEIKAPAVINELKEDYKPVFSYFLIREIKKTLKTFRASQKKMADQLYPDRSKEILSNPDIYQQLVDAWGDLADEKD